MFKIAYLHGLGASNFGPKNEWLKSVAEIFDPQIDYYQKNIYKELRNQIINFNPNIIVGSSMGGYFGYKIGRELNIKTLLFNPAIHSRSMEPDISGSFEGKFTPKMNFVFGVNDEEINCKKTIAILKNEGYKNEDFFILEHRHDTPLEVFKTQLLNFVNCF